jgi:hypothetical protein
MQLTQQDKQYLAERGFEIVVRLDEKGNITGMHPEKDEKFPYISTSITMISFQLAPNLRIVNTSFDDHDIATKLSDVEELVAAARGLDGRLFSTRPGERIKFFVSGPYLVELAKALGEKYTTKVEHMQPLSISQ